MYPGLDLPWYMGSHRVTHAEMQHAAFASGVLRPATAAASVSIVAVATPATTSIAATALRQYSHSTAVDGCAAAAAHIADSLCRMAAPGLLHAAGGH